LPLAALFDHRFHMASGVNHRLRRFAFFALAF
jgi:hypothetical protein